jgi:hypothetical protein
MVDMNKWIGRADEILQRGLSIASVGEKIAFATSFIDAFYGPESIQMKVFRQSIDNIERRKDAVQHNLELHARGTIKEVKHAVESGLIKGVRTLLSGEIIGDLLAIARERLEEDSESAKNVSAVLVAAAFEDTMRTMGSEFAGVQGRPKLESVVGELKEKQVLKGGEVGTALSYLKFRNDSMHADWQNVQKSQATSCLSFVETLLSKHFSG